MTIDTLFLVTFLFLVILYLVVYVEIRVHKVSHRRRFDYLGRYRWKTGHVTSSAPIMNYDRSDADRQE